MKLCNSAYRRTSIEIISNLHLTLIIIKHVANSKQKIIANMSTEYVHTMYDVQHFFGTLCNVFSPTSLFQTPVYFRDELKSLKIVQLECSHQYNNLWISCFEPVIFLPCQLFKWFVKMIRAACKPLTFSSINYNALLLIFK